jgi:hypothetical protein
MDYSNIKYLLRTSITMSVLIFNFKAYAIDTKRFDAPPLARPQYLTFSQPQELRYKALEPRVDRRNLLMPSDMKLVSVTVVTQNDSNLTSQTQPDFPLIGGSDNNATASNPSFSPLVDPSYNSNPVLPLSDPFNGVDSSSVNSTDELLQVFESTDFDTPRSRFQNIPFVPPYTITPDSMRMTNRATYQRIQR